MEFIDEKHQLKESDTNEEEFRKIFKRSSVKRTKHTGLKRNIKNNL